MTTCAPGTHFHRPDATKQLTCVWCGQPATPPPPRPQCPRCGGIGIQSLTWNGPPGSERARWRMDACEACGGTGTPREEEQK